MKVYKQDTNSVIEAWYLGCETSNFQAECEIVVNPKNKYLYNKIIIINELDFDYSRFIGKNFVISRFPIKAVDYLLIPYTISSDVCVSEPFRKSLRILYPNSLNEDNCYIEGSCLNLKYNYISVEGDNYKGYLTQTGFIASIIGII